MKTLTSILTVIGIFTISGCVKDKFDEPPYSGEDPQGVVANTSIATLKSIYTIGAFSPVEVADDWIICGIVNANDKSGNLYKTISIQDSTAGIQIKMDNSYLYNDYPVGRRIFIKCKGLFLGEYAGMVQLGGYIDNSDGRLQLGGISSVIAQDKILKGKWNQPVSILETSIGSLDNIAHQSLLIKLNDVEFKEADAQQPYADAVNLGSLNRTIEDCDENTMIVRTSGYAKFAGEKTPQGKGSITALFTIYKSGSNITPQLVIRDVNDVQLTEMVRCDGSSSNIDYLLNEEFANISDWKAISVAGAQVWTVSTYSGESFAKISGYSAGNIKNEDWLISKPLNLNGYNTVSMTFQSATKFAGSGLECYISANYSGSGAPGAATWTNVTASFAPENSNYEWKASGTVDLSNYVNQTVYIAYKYTSTTSAAATWEVDKVKVWVE